MARPKKTNALTPAQRKAASRERRKSSGLVRVHLKPEFYTVELLQRLAKFLNKTVSEVVTEIVNAYVPNEDGLPLGPAYVTRDAQEADLDLDLPKTVVDTLNSFTGFCASGALEILVGWNCTACDDSFIGLVASDQVEVTESDKVKVTACDAYYFRLVYTHPGTEVTLLTGMNALTPDKGFQYTKAANKYERRRNTVTEYARAASVNRAVAADNEPFGNAHLNRTLDAAMNRRQEQTNAVLWQRYYDASSLRYAMGEPDSGRGEPGGDMGASYD